MKRLSLNVCTLFSGLMLTGLFISPAQAAPEVYDINVPHTGLVFKVRHILNQVYGKFNHFEGTLTLDLDDLDQCHADITIPVKSINTGEKDRDAHLQTADFFNASKHPNLTFQSTKWEKTADNQYKITGNLTMNGITHPVVLDAQLNGFTEHPGNKKKVTGWFATTKISRTQWEINYGLPMVGDEVQLEISVQGHLRDTES